MSMLTANPNPISNRHQDQEDVVCLHPTRHLHQASGLILNAVDGGVGDQGVPIVRQPLYALEVVSATS